MKINRYIYIPFLTGAWFVLFNYLLLGTSPGHTLWNFISFALFGFGILFYNDYRVKKITAESSEEAYSVRQKRNIIVFANYEKTFDLCLKSIDVLQKAKIKSENKSEGALKIQTGLNWHSFGNKITYELKKITDYTTEIQLNVDPLLRTTLVDYGESFRLVETLEKYFDSANESVHRESIEAKKVASAEFHSNYKNNKVKVS